MHGTFMGMPPLTQPSRRTYVYSQHLQAAQLNPFSPRKSQSINGSLIRKTCCLFFVSYSFVSTLHCLTKSILCLYLVPSHGAILVPKAVSAQQISSHGLVSSNRLVPAQFHGSICQKCLSSSSHQKFLFSSVCLVCVFLITCSLLYLFQRMKHSKITPGLQSQSK